MIETKPEDYHKLNIDTPERIVLDIPLAGIGSRFVAQLIDDLIRGLVVLFIFFILIFLIPALSLDSFFDSLSTSGSVLIGFLIIFLFFSLYFGYDIYFEAYRNGQTPGMKVQRIRVVMDNGQPVTASATFIRAVVGVVDILPSNYLLGGLIALMRDDHKRLGDIIAGTSVIRLSSQNSFGVNRAIDPDLRDVFFPREKLEKLSVKDYEMLVQLRERKPKGYKDNIKLSQYKKLQNDIRKNLAHRMEDNSDLKDKVWLINLEHQLKIHLERQI